MWLWSIVMKGEKLDFEEQSDLDSYIPSLQNDVLKDSIVYDPDRRSMNAIVYAQMHKLVKLLQLKKVTFQKPSKNASQNQ